jgi:hypothetical protein
VLLRRWNSFTGSRGQTGASENLPGTSLQIMTEGPSKEYVLKPVPKAVINLPWELVEPSLAQMADCAKRDFEQCKSLYGAAVRAGRMDARQAASDLACKHAIMIRMQRLVDMNGPEKCHSSAIPKDFCEHGTYKGICRRCSTT